MLLFTVHVNMCCHLLPRFSLLLDFLGWMTAFSVVEEAATCGDLSQFQSIDLSRYHNWE